MTDTIEQALNEQMRREFQAAFLYLSFSTKLKEWGLHGAGHWMREQYREECGHALKFLSYLELQDAHVRIPSIESSDYKGETPADLFQLALQHERHITAAILELLNLCRREGNAATELMLHGFVREQVEEESNVRNILQELNLCGKHMGALLRLDERLGRRKAVQ